MIQLDIFGGSTTLKKTPSGDQLTLLSAEMISATLATPLPDLRINLKKIYFEEILNGQKTEEYRLCNEFWHKRLVGKRYEKVIICLGYPPKDDKSKILEFPYRGFNVRHIVHPEFGDNLVKVYAIPLHDRLH